MAHPSSDLTGIWRSSYHYTSSDQTGELEGEHYVQLQKHGSHLIFESLPHTSKSYLHMRLSLDGNIATGSWREETDPTGHYQGAVYYGAVQLVFDPAHKHLHGKWLGHDKRHEINVGPWELTYIGETMPEAAA